MFILKINIIYLFYLLIVNQTRNEIKYNIKSKKSTNKTYYIQEH